MAGPKKRLPELWCVLDLDAAFAAMLAVRLGFPPHVAVLVRQWDGIIALSYAAKRVGCTRLMNVNQALALCKSKGVAVAAVHVEVIDEAGRPRLPAPGEVPSQAENKVSLHQVRAASAEVFALLRRLLGDDCVHRASVDECYMVLDAAAGRVLAVRAAAARCARSCVAARALSHRLRRRLAMNSPSCAVSRPRPAPGAARAAGAARGRGPGLGAAADAPAAGLL